MAGNRGTKVTKYPQNLNNINIGMVFFAVMAIYIIISVITYFRKDHIVGYQVMEGSLSTNNIYDAVAIRKEEIIESDTAGYINYFATEGGRVAVGNLVYTVDESGQLLEYLKSQGSEEVSLSDEDLLELRTQIVNFDSSFDPHNFSTIYDFKVSLDGTVQKLSNNSILSNIQSLNSNSSTLQSINYRYAPNTGIVIYSLDGYEDLTLEQVTADTFDETAYEKTQLINNSLVKAGDPVYKICTSEEWSVVIKENDPEKVKVLEDLSYVKVKFIKNQDESWGKVSTYTNEQGDTFVALTFTNSMLTFCRDRFLDVELITEDEEGLKIPNSSIVNKSFYLIPKDYLIKNNENNTSVLRVKYDEQGNETSELVTVSVYSENETEYYVDNETLRSGDTLILTDSNQRFTVSKTDSLIGVYNINKGYAEFRQIKILYQNEEYAIVRPNTTYGLNVYDYIVLDSSTYDKRNNKNADIDDTSVENSSADGSSEDMSEDESSEDGSFDENSSVDENLEEITVDDSVDSSETGITDKVADENSESGTTDVSQE